MNCLAFLLWVCWRQLLAKSILCNNSEVPSNSIRLEKQTMSHKIPNTNIKVRSQRESWSPMDAEGSCQWVYCPQTSFLLGRPWLLTVKASALFSWAISPWMTGLSPTEGVCHLFMVQYKVYLKKSLSVCFQHTDFWFFFKKHQDVMFEFHHSLKEAGKKGCWTSTGKAYLTKCSVILETHVSHS